MDEQTNVVTSAGVEDSAGGENIGRVVACEGTPYTRFGSNVKDSLDPVTGFGGNVFAGQVHFVEADAVFLRKRRSS